MGVWYEPAIERQARSRSQSGTLGRVDGCDAQQAPRMWPYPAGIGEAAREAGFTYAGRRVAQVPLNSLNRVPT